VRPLAGRYVWAIAFAIGVVVDVRIDFAGAGSVFFGGRALALGTLGVLFGGELGLLGASGPGLCFLTQPLGLLTLLLDPAPASQSDECDREQHDRCDDDDDDQCCAHGASLAATEPRETL